MLRAIVVPAGRRPHSRIDPLSGLNVIIAAQRAVRTQGSKNVVAYPLGLPEFLATCHFCPGNEEDTTEELVRIPDSVTGDWRVRGFPNLYPVLMIEEEEDGEEGNHSEFFKPYIRNEVGAHEIVVASPRHNVCMSEMSDEEIALIFWAIAQRYWDLKEDGRFHFFYAFQNYGEGASQDHPHWQLEARQFAPRDVWEKYKRMSEYKVTHRGKCLLCTLLDENKKDGRLVVENDHFLAFVPFAPSEPFEVVIAPKDCASNFASYLQKQEIAFEFASILREVARRVRRVLQEKTLGEERRGTSDPPYLCFLYTAPYYDDTDGPYHWHFVFIPRTTSKVGHERGTSEIIIPVFPEDAADILRNI